MPKLMDHIMKVFKLDKVLSYVESDNELDVAVADIYRKTKIIDVKIKQMQEVLGELENSSHPPQDFDERIVKLEEYNSFFLEEFEKQVRRKKAFKRKDAK